MFASLNTGPAISISPLSELSPTIIFFACRFAKSLLSILSFVVESAMGPPSDTSFKLLMGFTSMVSKALIKPLIVILSATVLTF